MQYSYEKRSYEKKKPTETKLIKLTFKTIYFNRRNLQLVEERIWKKLKEKTENRNNRNIIWVLYILCDIFYCFRFETTTEKSNNNKECVKTHLFFGHFIKFLHTFCIDRLDKKNKLTTLQLEKQTTKVIWSINCLVVFLCFIFVFVGMGMQLY